MRYVIIAILLYIFYIILRTVLKSFLNNKTAASQKEQEKQKRTYNLDEVQDAEFREVKKDPSI
jgi:flagellar biosynthesis/type III secretory pathway M-ring protein FliF/YscJ